MAFLIKWREVCKTALSDGVVMLYQSISKKEQFMIFQPTKIDRWLLAQIEEIVKSVKNSATGRRLLADHDVPANFWSSRRRFSCLTCARKNTYKKIQLGISNMISDNIFSNPADSNEYAHGRESMLSITKANSMQRTRKFRLMGSLFVTFRLFFLI